MKNITSSLATLVKGVCMGAADVIPGVSGGTIALLMGIYDKLIASINAVDATALKLLFKGKFKELWKHINGPFLFSLIAGILLSILLIANAMQFLLNNYPIHTWAFFFGLIVASSIFLLKEIKDWKLKDYISLCVGIIFGVVICTLSPTTTPDSLWFIFLSGALAICAMILPGISGSFILLILGKYEYIMGTIAAITNGEFGYNLLVLALFALGAICGIIAFSRVIHWLLNRYNKETMIVLSGFIIGSLVKVWPWSNPEIVAAQESLHIPGAILFALIGLSLVIGIELLSKRKRG